MSDGNRSKKPVTKPKMMEIKTDAEQYRAALVEFGRIPRHWEYGELGIPPGCPTDGGRGVERLGSYYVSTCGSCPHEGACPFKGTELMEGLYKRPLPLPPKEEATK